MLGAPGPTVLLNVTPVIDRLSATSETARRVLPLKGQPNPSSETGLLVANLEIAHLVKTSVIVRRAAMQQTVRRRRVDCKASPTRRRRQTSSS